MAIWRQEQNSLLLTLKNFAKSDSFSRVNEFSKA